MYLVQAPRHYDVIVAENMFGDILSDLGAATVGGLGMAPSGDIGDRYAPLPALPRHARPTSPARASPIPLAAILSAALMLPTGSASATATRTHAARPLGSRRPWTPSRERAASSRRTSAARLRRSGSATRVVAALRTPPRPGLNGASRARNGHPPTWRSGGPHLRAEAGPTPWPGPGEMVVRVHACALNPLDIFTREGMPGEPTPLPHITGGDIAGVVRAVGPGVESPRVGDRVVLNPSWGCGAASTAATARCPSASASTCSARWTRGGWRST